jgi:NADH-quinone oxidoreductase subunit A
MTPLTPLAAYLLLFTAVGVGFIFVHLVAGKLIRPSRPTVEKGTIYECGEPTIGSAWIQFDLRFYVVALLFVIFDVEVAFFFPWAEVFGKANALARAEKPTTAEQYRDYAAKVLDVASPAGSTDMQNKEVGRIQKMHELTQDKLDAILERQAFLQSKPTKDLTDAEAAEISRKGALKDFEFEKMREEARDLSHMALYEVLVFFGVLLVGFAYLWRRGDLAWVRSTAAEQVPGAGVEKAPIRKKVAV